jgi:hypothetical protein
LVLGGAWRQDGKIIGSNEQFDAAGDAGATLDEPGAFEGQDHLVERSAVSP